MTFSNIAEGEEVNVFSVNGQSVTSFIANGNSNTVSLGNGFYIVRAGSDVTKFAVK